MHTVEEVGEEVGLSRDSGEHSGCDDSEAGDELHGWCEGNVTGWGVLVVGVGGVLWRTRHEFYTFLCP
jgi:hypothetical protein